MTKFFIAASWIASLTSVLVAGWRGFEGVKEVDHLRAGEVAGIVAAVVAGICALAIAFLIALHEVHQNDTSLKEAKERTEQERIRYGPREVS